MDQIVRIFGVDVSSGENELPSFVPDANWIKGSGMMSKINGNECRPSPSYLVLRLFSVDQTCGLMYIR